ncbi:MAG: serine protease, partial [Planctomycetaceae bacterium]
MSCLPVCCLRATTCLAALIAIAVGASPAGAQDLLEIVKRSTVLIDRGAHGSGSGFCVSAKGMFVTNAHVVKGTRVGGQVGVVIGAATADQQVLEARVVMIDEEHDLALLSSEPVPGVAELTLGGVEELRETQELTVLGYPFGRLLSYGAEYPAISVNVTRVSALRKEKGALSVVQIDGSVNPGNSGGPVVNQNGQVVAVISAGIPGSGVSFAIPATVVEKFLMRPALVMNLQECRYAERQNPIDFGFESICLNSAAQPNAFELTIDAGEGPGKPIKLTLADMKRKKKIKLLSRSETQAETLLLIVRRGADFAYVKTTNHDVKVGAKAFSLLDLRKLERRTVGTVVTMASGDKYAGTVSGWTDAERAGATIPLDDADRIDVYSLDPLLREVKCTLIARKAGKEVGKVQETVEFLGAPQQLKRSVVEKFLKELGPETAEQQALRARLREVRDTPEKIATWEARRKQSPKNWSVLEASSLVATDTASPSQFKFERQADGSYFVTGPQQASIYVFRCALPFPAAKLTAIRLEAIPDQRLPSNGSGRGPNGNFVVSRLDLSAVKKKESRGPFRGIRATADFFQ